MELWAAIVMAVLLMAYAYIRDLDESRAYKRGYEAARNSEKDQEQYARAP